MRGACMIVVGLVFAACSGPQAGGPPPPDRPSRIIESPGGMEIFIARDTRVHGRVLQGRPDRVWATLLEVYGELEIPVTTLDRDRGRLGNEQFVVVRRLGGRNVSALVDCGSTISGPIAGGSRIQMSLTTEMIAAGTDSTRVQSWLQATALANEGASRNPVTCTSLGRLEREIAERTAELLRGS